MVKSLRAISLWQPWASLMALGAKHIETRSWPTDYRGYVAIHAAQKWNADLRELTYSEPFWESLNEEYDQANDLPRGVIVAVGHLSGCLSTHDRNLIPAPHTNEHHFGDYAPKRYMWLFPRIWKLSSPVYVRGRQGFWTLTEGETDVVKAMLPEGCELDEGRA